MYVFFQPINFVLKTQSKYENNAKIVFLNCTLLLYPINSFISVTENQYMNS